MYHAGGHSLEREGHLETARFNSMLPRHCVDDAIRGQSPLLSNQVFAVKFKNASRGFEKVKYILKF